MNFLIAVLMSVSISSFAKAQTPVPVKMEDVQTALQSLRPQSLALASPSEYAYAEETTQIGIHPSSLTATYANTILSKYETPSTFQFRYHYDFSKLMSDGQFLYSSGEKVAIYNKGESPIYLTLPEGDYYDLKIEDIQIPIPELVQKSEKCGGLTDCKNQLAGTRVSFTFVDPGGTTFYRSVDGSGQVPFMSSPMRSCWQSLQGSNVVTKCLEIKDFDFQL